MEGIKLNTAISALMVFVNETVKAEDCSQEILEKFVDMLMVLLVNCGDNPIPMLEGVCSHKEKMDSSLIWLATTYSATAPEDVKTVGDPMHLK